ncbi:MAG: Mur ligase domain-containing protein [Verrucomicrobia bacterium]|nr:Mur ligase domain-containing protein [Verrucomicrobiota bacterium]
MKTRSAAVTVVAMLTGEPIRSVHFLGICGTAMAAVAAQLKQRGLRVTGSDENVYPPMSTFLAEQGITALSPYAVANLDAVAQDAVETETDLEVRSTPPRAPETVERTSKSVPSSVAATPKQRPFSNAAFATPPCPMSSASSSSAAAPPSSSPAPTAKPPPPRCWRGPSSMPASRPVT